MSANFKSLSDNISSRYEELKACGANKPGGGGFSAGNTCARGGGKGAGAKTAYQSAADKAKKAGDSAHNPSGSLLERSKRSQKAARAHYAAERVAPSSDLRRFHGDQAIMYEASARSLLDRYYSKKQK